MCYTTLRPLITAAWLRLLLLLRLRLLLLLSDAFPVALPRHLHYKWHIDNWKKLWCRAEKAVSSQVVALC